MSATHRGSVRAAFDSYPTPAWCTRRLLEAWAPGAHTILEPCAGDGAITKALREKYPAAEITALDIRPDAKCAGASVAAPGIDSLSLDWGQVDLIVTNPPFRLADAFLEKALRAARYVAFLLPFQRLADGHAEFFTRLGLPDLYVLPDRPAFVACTRCKAKCGWTVHLAPDDPTRFRTCGACGGPTVRGTQDVNCYAWFTWFTPNAKNDWGRFRYLAKTPLEERRLG